MTRVEKVAAAVKEKEAAELVHLRKQVNECFQSLRQKQGEIFRLQDCVSRLRLDRGHLVGAIQVLTQEADLASGRTILRERTAPESNSLSAWAQSTQKQ